MLTRRVFLKNSAVSVAAAAAPGPLVQASDDLPSSKSQRTPHKIGLRIKSVRRREETVLRHGGNGDNWHMSWASDDRQYLSLCDGTGFLDHFEAYYNSRMLVIEGGPRNLKFLDLPGYPMLGSPLQGPNDTRYYNFGTLALDGILYQFMSTFNRSFRSEEFENPDPSDVMRFNGVKLIYSPNGGRSWRNQDGSMPVVWEPWNRRTRETMVFFEEDQEAFSLLTILQMGKNYSLNRDGYVYVYSPNGNTEGTMNELVMFRVPKSNLLNRPSYEYFAGWSGAGEARWTKDIKARGVVHTFPRGWVNKLAHPYAWHPSVVYNAPLGLYMMANWGVGAAPDGTWFAKPSYLGFWVASDPWGPWTQIHEETAWLPAGDKHARAYQPQIAPKWIANDGKSFWLVWTDFQLKDRETYDRFYNNEIRDKYYRNEMTHGDWVRWAAMRSKHRPYYAFNAQQVDLVVA